MVKKLFIAAFVVDSHAFGFEPDQDAIAKYMTRLQDDGIGPAIVWSSVDDMIADHQRGPITAEYLIAAPLRPDHFTRIALANGAELLVSSPHLKVEWRWRYEGQDSGEAGVGPFDSEESAAVDLCGERGWRFDSARINLDFPHDTMGTLDLIESQAALFGLKPENYIERGPAGGNPNADLVGPRIGIVRFLAGFSAEPAYDETRIVEG